MQGSAPKAKSSVNRFCPSCMTSTLSAPGGTLSGSQTRTVRLSPRVPWPSGGAASVSGPTRTSCKTPPASGVNPTRVRTAAVPAAGAGCSRGSSAEGGANVGAASAIDARVPVPRWRGRLRHRCDESPGGSPSRLERASRRGACLTARGSALERRQRGAAHAPSAAACCAGTRMQAPQPAATGGERTRVAVTVCAPHNREQTEISREGDFRDASCTLYAPSSTVQPLTASTSSVAVRTCNESSRSALSGCLRRFQGS